ncbi:uncharacterized protein K452DRAFT_193178, partial [Aplosporella prunicola CBS 121167]
SGLTVFLNIVHFRFGKVPNELDLDSLLALSVLTDRYLATACVQPWIENWMQKLEHLAEKDDCYEWLWIAWEYGNKKVFERLARRLVLDLTLNEEGELL